MTFFFTKYDFFYPYLISDNNCNKKMCTIFVVFKYKLKK